MDSQLIRTLCITGTSAEWATHNIILAKGELGYDSTNKALKVGDGITPFLSLPAASTWASGAILDNIDDGTFYKRIEAAIADILNTGDVTSLVSSATELSEGKVQLASDTDTDAGKAIQANDPRLSDSRTPTPHASSHASTGEDAITPADIGAAVDSDITSAITTHNSETTSIHGIADTSDLVFTDDERLSDARTPTPHVASHATSGADALTPSDIGAITPDEVSDAISAALDPHTTNTSIHVSDSTKIAAKPTISSGAGKIQALVASSGNRVTLPGTSSELWFYFILHYNSSGTLSLTTPAATGIAAGASLVGTAETGYLYSGFGYRVS